MSTRAGIVAVIIALGLIVVALIVMRSGPQTSAPPVPEAAPFSTEDVGTVTITYAGKAHTVTRNDRGGWSIAVGDGSWPVDPQPVDAMLRLIASLAEDKGASSQTPPPLDRLITIDLVSDSGVRETVAFTDTPVAGKVLALRSGKPFALGDARIIDLAMRPGPLEWRSRMAIPDLDARGAARVSISTGPNESIELARLDSVWRVRRPMSARAHPDAVSTLLDRLASMRVLEFADDATAPEPPSLSMAGASAIAPGARTIELAWDQRSAQPDGTLALQTIVRKIVFDSAPGAQKDRIRATVDGPAHQRIFVPADAPMGVSTAARNYLAATATGVSPADVGFLRIRWTSGAESGFRREGLGWTAMPAGTQTDGAPVEALLRFLFDQSGEPQESFQATDVRSLARIELMDFEAEPLDFLDVGYTADGVLAVRSGSVVWLYGPGLSPELLALPDFSSLPPTPETPSRPSGAPVEPK